MSFSLFCVFLFCLLDFLQKWYCHNFLQDFFHFWEMHFFTLLLYNEKYMSLSKSTMDQAYNKILQVLKLNEREKKKTNWKTGGFLDVRLDLINNTRQLYHSFKPSGIAFKPFTKYFERATQSKAIDKWITDISCNQDIFDSAKSIF